jgi:hypothetical protein
MPPSDGKAWLGLLERITFAGATGRGLDPTDTAAISDAITNAVAANSTIDRGAGLPRQWRSQWRLRQRTACVLALRWKANSDRSFAEQLHRDLTRYRAGARFASDAAGNTTPQGDVWFWHAIIRCNRNTVPTKAALKRWLKLPL